MPKKQDRERLTIRLEHGTEGLDPHALILVLQETITALEQIAKNQHPSAPKAPPRIVQAEMNSPLQMTLDASSEAARPFVRGIRHLQTRATLPPGLPPETLTRIQSLAAVLKDHRADAVAFSLRDETVSPATVTRQVALNVATAIGALRPKRGERTSVVGILETVRLRGASSILEIKDRLTGERLRCRFAREAMLDQVKDALPSRVELTGRIEYGSSGEPELMVVEELRKLDYPGHPRVEDLKGITFTEDMDHADYVIGLRDDE